MMADGSANRPYPVMCLMCWFNLIPVGSACWIPMSGTSPGRCDNEPASHVLDSSSLYPRPDSNWDSELRRFAFYPLEPQGHTPIIA